MAENSADAIFKIGSVSLSTRRKGGPCSLLNAARHLSREIQAEMGATAKIDPTRTHLNVRVAGPQAAAEVVELAGAAARRAGVDVSSLKRDYCQAIELLFCLPAGAAIGSEKYFRNCLDWCAEMLAGVVVLCAVVHHDEDHPHMHVLLSPFKAGVSIARDVKSAKSVHALVVSFFDKVAGPAGLKRGGAKLYGKAKEAAVAMVLQRLTDEGVRRSAGWPSIRASVESNVMSYMVDYGIGGDDVRAIVLRAGGPGAIVLSEASGEPVDNLAQNDEGLSCVVLLPQTQPLAPQNTPPELAPVRHADLSTRTGLAVVGDAEQTQLSTRQRPDIIVGNMEGRRQVAREAQERAIAIHAPSVTAIAFKRPGEVYVAREDVEPLPQDW